MLWDDETSEQQAKLVELKALEAELANGPDAALRALGAPTDPIRTRAALGILIRAERYRDAGDIIDHRPPDRRWVDIATFVFARLGDLERAQKLVDDAEQFDDQAVASRARINLASGVIDGWQKAHNGQSPLSVLDWQQGDRGDARTALEALQPLLDRVRRRRRIRGDLELGAISNAVYCQAVLRDFVGIKNLGNWLATYVPVPLLLADLCLRHLAECPTNIAGRLRAEHHGEFQARFVAALMDREFFGRAEAAFSEFENLVSATTNDAEREAAIIAMFETSGFCSKVTLDHAIKLLSDRQPSNTMLVGVLRSAKRAAENDLEGARKELELIKSESDSVWWQAWAQLCQKLGNSVEAEQAWVRASELLPHPDVLRRSAQASLEKQRYGSAIVSLNSLLKQSPNDKVALRNLVVAHIRVGDFRSAADYLSRLTVLEPDESDYRITLAQCLARSNRLPEAIEALQPVCELDDPPLQAVLLQSELLADAGDSKRAFAILDDLAADNWANPEFVCVFMRRAHAAGDDAKGHEALARLIELRRAGKVPDALMREATLEDLLQIGKAHQTRRETLQTEVVRGRFPWLMVEDILGNPPNWAWTIHTQPLKWLPEEPLVRAGYSVYATNGFAVHADGERARMDPIEAVGQNSEIVVDLSALLTLHQLGRLETAAQYFSRMILPASYGELWARDANRYGQHQPSRGAEIDLIFNEIARGRVKTVSATDQSMVVVDEYSEKVDTHVYRLRDLLPPLRAAQKTDESAIERVLRVAQKPSGADEAHPAIVLGASVIVDEQTLRTLANQEIFGDVLDTFSIHLNSQQRDELQAERLAREEARNAKLSEDEMWKTIRRLEEQEKVELRPLPPADTTNDEDEDDDFAMTIHLDASRLAEALDKALMADDRVLQTMVLHKRPANMQSAFGTDKLLAGLMDGGNLDVREVANDFQKLMRWRLPIPCSIAEAATVLG